MSEYSFGHLKKAAEQKDLWIDVAAKINRDNQSRNFNNKERISRALSWYQLSEKSDEDNCLIYSYITLNALYSKEPNKEHEYESQIVNEFIENINELDTHKILVEFLNNENQIILKDILNIQYLFTPYWNINKKEIFSAKEKSKRWKAIFNNNYKKAEVALSEGDIVKPLAEVLGRIRNLRNQLMHGECGYQDFYNRTQVKLCSKFLFDLVGRFVKIMIESPQKSWGNVLYPPQSKPDEPTAIPFPLSRKS